MYSTVLKHGDYKVTARIIEEKARRKTKTDLTLCYRPFLYEVGVLFNNDNNKNVFLFLFENVKWVYAINIMNDSPAEGHCFY